MESIQLRLGETNEITFGINIQASKSVQPTYRFICEGTDMSYSIDGLANETGEVCFTLPPLKKDQVAEHTKGRLEVIIDDRIYTPMQVQIEFERPTTVVAEGVTVKNRVPKKDPVITVRPLKASKPNPTRPAQQKATNAPTKVTTLREAYEQQRRKT